MFGPFPYPNSSFFVFDLSGISGKISSVNLELQLVAYSANETEMIRFFDITSDIASLQTGALNTNTAMTDIGSGAYYGAQTFSAAGVGAIHSVTLTAAAVADIQQRSGGLFAIGAALYMYNGPSYDEYLSFGTTSTPSVARLVITFAPVAVDDTASTAEGAAAAGNVLTNDTDAGSAAVIGVNDAAASVGQPIRLASGALLTLNGDGTYTYDPAGAFDYLVSAQTGAATGALSSATDTFTYTVTGGDTATVTVTVTGQDGAGDRLTGTGGDNVINGTAANNVFDFSDGGADTGSGFDGVDSFYFGGAFTAADSVNGGGNRDALLLQGDYSAGVTLGTGTVSNIVDVESISLLSGSNTAYGEPGTNRYDYRLTMLDSNVAAGALMKVNGFHLLAGEDFTFDGSAETDAGYQIFAGLGLDKLVGGQQNDNFIFGQDGRFAAGDSVTGGGGYDVLYLRGNYTIDFNAPGYMGLISGVESIGLLSATSNEFVGGGGTEFDYTIVWSDTMLGSGQTMTVNGSRLTQTEALIFDGQLESDGNLRLWGGAANDQIKGGNGNDVIYGGKGWDTLSGNGGADTFLYYDVADSAPVPGSFDQIQGFTHLVDKIDLQRIDANAIVEGDQAFQFIGNALFSGAGQLRAVQLPASFGSNVWQIEGDVNGDGTPDFLVRLTVEAGQPLTASDFIF
jgi:VCBS repeat-containing protein